MPDISKAQYVDALLRDHADLLENLPFKITRHFTAIHETNSVMGATMASMNAKLHRLIDALGDDRVPQQERLLLLRDVAADAMRIKGDGEARMERAAAVAGALRGHSTHSSHVFSQIHSINPAIPTYLPPPSTYPHMAELDPNHPVFIDKDARKKLKEDRQRLARRKRTEVGKQKEAEKVAGGGAAGELGELEVPEEPRPKRRRLGAGPVGGGTEKAADGGGVEELEEPRPKRRRVGNADKGKGKAVGIATAQALPTPNEEENAVPTTTHKRKERKKPASTRAPPQAVVRAAVTSSAVAGPSSAPVPAPPPPALPSQSLPAPPTKPTPTRKSSRNKPANADAGPSTAPVPAVPSSHLPAAPPTKPTPTRKSSRTKPSKPAPVTKKEASVKPEPEAVNADAEEDDRTYCVCGGPSYGEMIACEGEDCRTEWFHLDCVRLEATPEGAWFCDECLARGTRKGKGKAGRKGGAGGRGRGGARGK